MVWNNVTLLIHFFFFSIRADIPPGEENSSTSEVEATAPFLAGNGGGESDDSSCNVLPFLAGSTGGISQYSASVFSVESNVLKMVMNEIWD